MPNQSYEVGLLYCNGQDFSHHHTELKEATTEYADLLATAIEADRTDEATKHLRLVHLEARDGEGEIVQHISSGLFECDHDD